MSCHYYTENNDPVHHKGCILETPSCWDAIIYTEKKSGAKTFFPLIIMLRSQNGSNHQGGAVSDLFLDKNSSTFEGGTKIVPGVELSYVP